MVADFSCQFTGRNKLNISRLTSGGHAWAPLDRVMVGQCHRPEPEALGMGGQFFRREGAVGKIGVKM